jgi:NhaA family Na+:H+ antiporter
VARKYVRLPVRRLGRRLPPLGDEFVSVEAFSGIVLLGAAIAALVWANLPGSTYSDVWHTDLTLGVGHLSITEDLRHWVNDALMTLFFFVVGLEIKRELAEGELRQPRTAALPALAALGGMLVPALIFLAFNPSAPGNNGWGIPVATDIAFAVGVLALLGERVPKGLKLFLLTLAVVDDIGAIILIAIFYSHGVSWAWLGGALTTLLLIVLLRKVRIAAPIAYVLPGVVLWTCTFESGLHATIAGVILGLLTPIAHKGKPVLGRLEHYLHPWTSFLVIPLFAFANAGVVVGVDALSDAVRSRVTLGVLVGLVVGKTIGVNVAVAAALRLRVGRLPQAVRRGHILGAAALAGIGFTVSLFIADLSYTGDARLEQAKIGILAASLLSGVIGAAVLLYQQPRKR